MHFVFVCILVLIMIVLLFLLGWFCFWFLAPVFQYDALGPFVPHPMYFPSTPKNEQGNTKERKQFPCIVDEDRRNKGESDVYLSVIVPAYKETERLPKMMEEVVRVLEEWNKEDKKMGSVHKWEIIIVDDGSRDGTTETALTFVEKHSSELVRVLTLKENVGKGGAVQMGMLHSRGKYLLMADADGATKFADARKVLDNLIKVEKNGFGVCIGSRAHLQENAIAERAWYRNILMFVFHFLVMSLTVKNIRDTQCGFKIFTRKTAAALFSNLHLKRWCFDVEILFMAQQLQIPMIETSVNWQEIDGSKLSIIDSSFQMARDLVLIRFCYMFGLWRIEHQTELYQSIHEPSQKNKSI